MAWVTWRQHRSQFVAMAGLLVALAAAVLGTHLPIQAAYHRDTLSECLPPTARSGCDIIVRHFQGEFDSLVAARPRARRAARTGRPVRRRAAARARARARHAPLRLDAGRHRRRWLLSKTALLAAATVAGGAVASALVMWWRSPFDTLEGRMSPSGFDIEGLVVPAYAFFALAAGVFAGLLFRRTVARCRRRSSCSSRHASSCSSSCGRTSRRRCIAPSRSPTPARQAGTGC